MVSTVLRRWALVRSTTCPEAGATCQEPLFRPCNVGFEQYSTAPVATALPACTTKHAQDVQSTHKPLDPPTRHPGGPRRNQQRKQAAGRAQEFCTGTQSTDDGSS